MTVVNVAKLAGMRVADGRVEGEYRMFLPVSFSAADAENPPEWIPFLPAPGEYIHPWFDLVVITAERNAHFVEQFNNNVYQKPVALDAEHMPVISGAYGWINELRMNDDGSADAKVEWTPRGLLSLKNDEYRFISPSWLETWVNPSDGVTYTDIVIGGALTTRPFFKDNASGTALRPLIVAAGEPLKMAVDTTGLNFAELPRKGSNVENEGQSNPPAPNPPSPPQPSPAPSLAPQPNPPAPQPQPVTMSEEMTRRFAELEGQIATLRTANESLAASNKAAQEQVAALRQAEQAKRFSEEVTGRSSANNVPWLGGAEGWEGHIKILSSLAASFGEESDEFKQYVSSQRSAAVAVRQAQTFREHGRAPQGPDPLGGATESAMSSFDAKLKQMREKEPDLTEPQAWDRLLKTREGQQMYSEYQAERRVRPGGA